MNREDLYYHIKQKKSFLCIGLDTDIAKIPMHLLDLHDPVYEFNKEIIKATHDLCVAYKPNIAFYEARGSESWLSLEKTMGEIPPGIFKIADAKRGDIGNTTNMYARAFFDQMDFDSITVSPYMGEDSVKPYLDYKNRWVIILAVTSNISAFDFQFLPIAGTDQKVFEKVISVSQKWGTTDNTMYVVGATKANMLEKIREMIPDHFLLVPGVGAQGGNLEEVAKYGFNSHCGLLVNSSRNIIYASSGVDFAEAAREEAKKMQKEMKMLLERAELV
ncbi:MAG: orotidine-5'-phosphate decarboxylase [Bacteroidia bacterium]